MKLKKLFKKNNDKQNSPSAPSQPLQTSKRTFSFSSHSRNDTAGRKSIEPSLSSYGSLTAARSKTSLLSIDEDSWLQNSPLHDTTSEKSYMGAASIATDRTSIQPIKSSTRSVRAGEDNPGKPAASTNTTTFAASPIVASSPSKLSKSFLGKSSRAASVSSLNQATVSPTTREIPKKTPTETTRSSHSKINILGFSGLKQQSSKKPDKNKSKVLKDGSTETTNQASHSFEQPSFTPSTTPSSACSNINNLLNHLNIAAGENWPPPRIWVPVKESLIISSPSFNGGFSYSDETKRSPLGFSVMSYNILSRLYTHRLDNTNLSNVLNNLYSNVAGHNNSFSSSSAVNGLPTTLSNTHLINASGRPSRTLLQQQLHQQRVNLIAKEIKTYNPDIICFQELDSLDYSGQFRLDMSNYESVYAPKTALFGQSSTVANQPSTSRFNSISGQPLIKPLGYSPNQNNNFTTGRIVEGCGIYFRMDRFHLIEKRIFNYADLTLNDNSKSAASKKMTETLISNEEAAKFASERDTRERVAGRSHVGIIVVLRHVASNEIVIVCNTQLIPDLKGSSGIKNTKSEVSNSFADVRMVQIGLCLEQIEFYVNKYSPNTPTTSSDNQNKVPVILCGDLNARVTSGVYEIINGKTPISNLPEWNGRRYARFTDPSYEWLSGKRLGLKSSYVKRNSNDYESNYEMDCEIDGLKYNDNSVMSTPSANTHQDDWKYSASLALSGDSKIAKRKHKTRTLSMKPFESKQLIPFTKFGTDSLETFDYIWYSSPTLAVSEVLGTFQAKSKVSDCVSEKKDEALPKPTEDKKSQAANIDTNSPSSLSDDFSLTAPHLLPNSGSNVGGSVSSASSFSSTFSSHSGFTSASTSTALSSLNSSGKANNKNNTSGISFGNCGDPNDKGLSNSDLLSKDRFLSDEVREKEKQLHEFLQYPHPSDHLCIMTKFLFKNQRRH